MSRVLLVDGEQGDDGAARVSSSPRWLRARPGTAAVFGDAAMAQGLPREAEEDEGDKEGKDATRFYNYYSQRLGSCMQVASGKRIKMLLSCDHLDRCPVPKEDERMAVQETPSLSESGTRPRCKKLIKLKLDLTKYSAAVYISKDAAVLR